MRRDSWEWSIQIEGIPMTKKVREESEKKPFYLRLRMIFLENEGAAHYWNPLINMCMNESSDKVYFI